MTLRNRKFLRKFSPVQQERKFHKALDDLRFLPQPTADGHPTPMHTGPGNSMSPKDCITSRDDVQDPTALPPQPEDRQGQEAVDVDAGPQAADSVPPSPIRDTRDASTVLRQATPAAVKVPLMLRRLDPYNSKGLRE